MAAVRMHIDKFKGVVLINEDHPLAVAQRAKDAERARTPEPEPSAEPPAPPAARAPLVPRRRRKDA